MSESYWEKRFKAIEEKSFEEAEKCIKESVKYIDDAVRNINKEILFWLNRFAKNNNISLAEAKKLITLKDLEELGWDVSKYIAKGSNNKTGEYTQELENASVSHHITRLEAIKQQMNEKCEKGFGSVEKSLSSTLLKVYEDTYYKTAYEVQKKVGIGFSFAQVDEKKLKTILEKPWASDGSNFSDRIWKSYKPKLVNNMQKKLVDWCINGIDVQKLTDNLAKESDVVEKACATLIHTEVSNICNQSQVDSYKEMGVEKYKNLETLDGITCKVCGGHDGEVHDIDEFQVGLTAPPFHPRCRGTTIPVTDNLLSKNRQRAARDPETGKTVYVNEMTYEEWKENFVNEKGQQAWDYYSKSSKNLKIDTEQFDRYKDVLGKYAPENLEEFQKIKYNNTSEWNSLKHNYRIVNSYEDNSGSMDKMKIVELDDFAFNTKTKGFTGRAKNKANIAVMELDGEIKIANSQLNNEEDAAYKNFKYDEVNKLFENKSVGKITKDNLVLQKKPAEFQAMEVGSHTREMDSEAKLFEYAADIAKDGKKHTINMLSEKCMCDSCLGVMKQFKENYPNVTVNVVSNKKERAEKNHNKPWKIRKE